MVRPMHAKRETREKLLLERLRTIDSKEFEKPIAERDTEAMYGMMRPTARGASNAQGDHDVKPLKEELGRKGKSSWVIVEAGGLHRHYKRKTVGWYTDPIASQRCQGIGRKGPGRPFGSGSFG